MGTLYENGQGVERDQSKALNLYREGSGISGDELIYSSIMTSTVATMQSEFEALHQTMAGEREKSSQLRAQVEQLKAELDQRRRALEHSQSQLKEARSQLKDAQARLLPTAPDLALLSEVRAAREEELAAERELLERDRKANAEKIVKKRTQLAALKSDEARIERLHHISQANEQQLNKVKSAAAEIALALADSLARLEQMEVELAANKERQQAEQKRYELERNKMEVALAASKEDRELLLLLEQQLSEKQREVSRQRGQISALESRQNNSVNPLTDFSPASAPVITIIEPLIVATRGASSGAATVRTVKGAAEIIGKVIAPAGLQQLLVNEEKLTVAANGVFKIKLPVASQGAPVRVSAVDKLGVRSQLDFTLAPAPEAASAAAGSVWDQRTSSEVKFGKYYALIIGNNNYDYYANLTSGISDARKIADVLGHKYGFTTRVLLDANRFEILSALNDMRARLKAEDNLLVYFAGHGEIDEQSHQGYWLPTDAKKNAPDTWLSNRAISDMLNTMVSRHVMVIADSCYSGSMAHTAVPVFTADMSDKARRSWLRTLSGNRSRTVLTSGGLAPVPDVGRGGNSHFANALVAALEDNTQLIEGQQLFRTVAITLASAAAESDLIQVPGYAPIQFAGHEAGEFFFVPKNNEANANGRDSAQIQDPSPVKSQVSLYNK